MVDSFIAILISHLKSWMVDIKFFLWTILNQKQSTVVRCSISARNFALLYFTLYDFADPVSFMLANNAGMREEQIATYEHCIIFLLVRFLSVCKRVLFPENNYVLLKCILFSGTTDCGVGINVDLNLMISNATHMMVVQNRQDMGCFMNLVCMINCSCLNVK